MFVHTLIDTLSLPSLPFLSHAGNRQLTHTNSRLTPTLGNVYCIGLTDSTSLPRPSLVNPCLCCSRNRGSANIEPFLPTIVRCRTLRVSCPKQQLDSIAFLKRAEEPSIFKWLFVPCLNNYHISRCDAYIPRTRKRQNGSGNRTIFLFAVF